MAHANLNRIIPAGKDGKYSLSQEYGMIAAACVVAVIMCFRIAGMRVKRAFTFK